MGEVVKPGEDIPHRSLYRFFAPIVVARELITGAYLERRELWWNLFDQVNYTLFWIRLNLSETFPGDKS